MMDIDHAFAALMARIRRNDGADRLSAEQRAALEFFGDPERSLEELHDEELQQLIAAVGGWEAATKIRLGARELEEFAEDDEQEGTTAGEESGVEEEQKEEADDPSSAATHRLSAPHLQALFPGELGELAGRIARYALFRQMMTTPAATARTTQVFLQDQLATREARQLLAAARRSGEEFVLQIADAMVELLMDELARQVQEQEQTGSVRHARELLEALRKLPAALATVSDIDRRAFCLHQFLELSASEIAAQLGLPEAQVAEHLRRAEFAVDSAL